MNKYEIEELLGSVRIEKPCGMDWSDMSGDDGIRLCSQCNLNVHNLSAMNEKEAAAVLKRRQSERTCIYFRRKEDGSVIVDNCPQQLKKARDRLLSCVAATLFGVAYGIYLSSPDISTSFIDPNYIGVNDKIWLLARSRVDTAEQILRLITLFSFLIVFFIPMSKEKKESKRRIVIELFALGSVPFLVNMGCKLIVESAHSVSMGV